MSWEQALAPSLGQVPVHKGDYNNFSITAQRFDIRNALPPRDRQMPGEGREIKDSGGRRWRFSGGLPKLVMCGAGGNETRIMTKPSGNSSRMARQGHPNDDYTAKSNGRSLMSFNRLPLIRIFSISRASSALASLTASKSS